jgi:hypothetical protein
MPPNPSIEGMPNIRLRKRAGLQLVLPTVVLLGAAGLAGYLYLFNQDWLHTIIFSEYVGLGYFVYLALAVALLTDVLFNRAGLHPSAQCCI